jgi:hypothetical protein
MSQGRFAKAWWSEKQDVIQALPTITGGIDEDRKVVGQALLADEIVQGPRPDSLFKSSFGSINLGLKYLAHGLTLADMGGVSR